jgi:hypothetical protein
MLSHDFHDQLPCKLVSIRARFFAAACDAQASDRVAKAIHDSAQQGMP